MLYDACTVVRNLGYSPRRKKEISNLFYSREKKNNPATMMQCTRGGRGEIVSQSGSQWS
jgi:hypothetical protein